MEKKRQMRTIIKKLNKENLNQEEGKEIIQKATEFLQEGKLVAFPTETVYGLGADGLNEKAAEKIYAAKGRPSDNPLILHIAREEQLSQLVKSVPKKAKILIEKYWPGPLTMIFEKSEIVPYGTTGGLETVAIRMPDHPVARALLLESNIAVAAPSANTSGRPSPTKAEHVEADLDGKIDMIIDGGEVGIGIESTIVDMTVEPPMILRPGYITKEMLSDTLGDIAVDQAVLKKPDPGIRPKAPGMKYKHYAPKGDLHLFSGEIDRVVSRINELARQKVEAGCKVGIIATDETISKYQYGKVLSIGKRVDENSIAHNLYRVLRDFDEAGVEYILGEAFSENNFGQAIMNRLNKAAAYQIEHVE